MKAPYNAMTILSVTFMISVKYVLKRLHRASFVIPIFRLPRHGEIQTKLLSAWSRNASKAVSDIWWDRTRMIGCGILKKSLMITRKALTRGRTDNYVTYAQFPKSGLLFSRPNMPLRQRSCVAKIFSYRKLLTATFNLTCDIKFDLDNVKFNQHAKYLCRRSFRSTVVVRTDRQTDRHAIDWLLYLGHRVAAHITSVTPVKLPPYIRIEMRILS